MLNTLRNALTVPDIRKRIGFVFFAFAVFVFMIHVQLPNVDQAQWNQLIQSGAFYQFLGFLSGGALQKLSIIAMGITPYINASIIMQLMTVVMPQLEEMAKKGGEEGRKKISRYTRWLTIVLGTIQATSMSIAMNRGGVFYDHSWQFMVYAVIAFVAGTMFLMWLGEQITDKGIGNGVSLIIFVGIVLRFPTQVGQTFSLAGKGNVNWFGIILWLAIALITIVSIVFMYQGQRRIPVQQARRVVGRKMFAGRSTYIPLRLNNAGRHLDHLRDLDPAAAAAGALVVRRSERRQRASPGRSRSTSRRTSGPARSSTTSCTSCWSSSSRSSTRRSWSTPKTSPTTSRRSGSFIPGIRPGQPTVDYINKILVRITTAAAIYLGVLAVLPSLQRDVGVTSLYIGSTSLLIVVGVALDSITQIEARLAMRDYRGFIKK